MATAVVTPTPTTPAAAPAPAPTSIAESLRQDYNSTAGNAPETPVEAPPATTSPEAVPDAQVAAEVITDPTIPVGDEVPVVEETPQIDGLPEDPLAEIQPDSISQDGKRHFYNPTKSQKLQADHKMIRELSQIIPEVSVDAIKDLATRANKADTLLNMFRSGPEDINAMDSMLGEFHQTDPHAFGVMAIRALTNLPAANPLASQEVDRIFNNRILNQARARVSQITDPAAREAEANYVQNMEMRLTGTYTPKAQLLAGGNQDPIAAERQWIQQEKDRIAQFHQNQAQQAKVARINSINTAEESAVVGHIDTVLAPIKANSAFSPADIEDIRGKFVRAIQEAEGANPVWGDTYKNLRMEAERSGSPEAIERVSKFRRSIADQVIRQKSREIIGQRGQSVQSANQAQHQQAGQAPRTELSPNGVTAPAPNGAVDAMLKAKTWDEMFAAMPGARK